MLLWWKNSTPRSIVPLAMFVLFFEMKKQELSNGHWARSYTSSIAAHMIGPAILIHITIFAQHTLINVVLVIWLQSIGRKNTKCVLCGNLSNWISQTLLKSICFFDPLATGDQSSKVEILKWLHQNLSRGMFAQGALPAFVTTVLFFFFSEFETFFWI